MKHGLISDLRFISAILILGLSNSPRTAPKGRSRTTLRWGLRLDRSRDSRGLTLTPFRRIFVGRMGWGYERPVFLPTTTKMRLSSSVKRRGANLLLLTFSVMLVLVGAEVVLSLFYPTEYLQVPDRDSADLFESILHQPSAVPGLSFELSPNRQKKYEGIWIRTNNQGMRDSEPLPIGNPSVSRIVVLGDSFTFGYRVDVASSFPSLLEQKLNQGATQKQFEVLNLGVCGYNTQDEALVLEHKGLPWQPDLVILSYVLNDPENQPVQPLNSYFHQPAMWERSNLARLAAKAIRDLQMKLWGGGDYYRYLHAQDREKWNGVLAAFDDIRSLTDGQQIPVLVAIFPETRLDREQWNEYPYQDIHRQVTEISRDRGFEVIDLLDRFSEYPARSLRVRLGDPHPSPFAHAVAVEEIYKWIASELPRRQQLIPDPAPAT
jgi:lysophospholipase L1-like esterase